jgi:hypothetical protein
LRKVTTETTMVGSTAPVGPISLGDLLGYIRTFKLTRGYPPGKEKYLACPFERHSKTNCMRDQKDEWGGHQDLRRLKSVLDRKLAAGVSGS